MSGAFKENYCNGEIIFHVCSPVIFQTEDILLKECSAQYSVLI